MKRLGRFGWKAGTTSVKHQVASALNTDMGVMTSVLPKPDCGPMQTNCGNDKGLELPDEHLEYLVKYVSLLGVRAQRNLDDPAVIRGEKLFGDTGCASCHVTTHHDYLHDGRARTIEEAILWHGGEGQKSHDAYVALTADDNNALLKFLESL